MYLASRRRQGDVIADAPRWSIALRGQELRSTRRKALERLNAHRISTTLVVTLRKGLNDGEIGAIIDYALLQPCVRGVTFQPVQHAGRAVGFNRPPIASR